MNRKHLLTIAAVIGGLVAFAGTSAHAVSLGPASYTPASPSYNFDASSQTFSSGTQSVSMTTPPLQGLRVCLEDENGNQECENTDPVPAEVHTASLSITGLRSSTPPDLSLRGNDGTWSCDGGGTPLVRIGAFTGTSSSDLQIVATVDGDTQSDPFMGPFVGNRTGRALGLCTINPS